MFTPQHWHMTATGVFLPNAAITGFTVQNFLRQIIRDVRMHCVTGPWTYESDVVGNEGISGIAMLDTSHTSMHCWTKPEPNFTFDLYSCKPFLTEDTFPAFERHGVSWVRYTMINRNNRAIDGRDTIEAEGLTVFRQS